MRRALLLVVLVACGGDDAVPVFPAGYQYTEVRDCRTSSDHELNRIRVLADPAALAPYRDRAGDFPEGAIVLKEEFDFGDTACAGPIKQWTVMQRQAGAWHWQKVAADRHVISEDDDRCISCHAMCGVPPDGYLGTCALP